jgi:hypothetical protein
MRSAFSLLLTLSSASLLAVGLAGCTRSPVDTGSRNPIVGAWLVNDPNAPFPFHMYVFNADGTMQQANPDAGDSHASDSDGKGVWAADGNRIKGKWVEVIADRTSHKFTGRLEVTFHLTVKDDKFTGTETVSTYDEHGNPAQTLDTRAEIEGRRVKLP